MWLSAFLALIVTLSPGGERQLVDRIVAVVNDDIISMSQLDDAAHTYLTDADTEEKRKALYRDVLDQLIADQLLTQQIREAKIEVTEDEVERAIKDIVRQNNIAEGELQSVIESRGMSMARYREDLKKQLVRLKIVDMKVRSRVVIPEADVRAEHDRQVNLEKREELLQLRHLFFRFGASPDPGERERVVNRAKEARTRVVNGEDFAKVAKDLSEGPTAVSGGDLGEVSRSGLLPELSRAIVDLKVGEISPPVITSNGVHVLRIEARKTKEPESFEKMRAQIHQRLYQAEVERQMKVWIDELRAESAIDVRL